VQPFKVVVFDAKGFLGFIRLFKKKPTKNLLELVKSLPKIKNLLINNYNPYTYLITVFLIYEYNTKTISIIFIWLHRNKIIICILGKKC
jgi:hypothetical protein